MKTITGKTCIEWICPYCKQKQITKNYKADEIFLTEIECCECNQQSLIVTK